MEARVVFIVEDNLLSRRQFQTALERKVSGDVNLDILHVTNIQDARKLLESLERNRINAVIMDNNFPATPNAPEDEQGRTLKVKGAGLSIIRDMRAGKYGDQVRDLPILFVSGEMNHQLAAEAEGLSDSLPIKCLRKEDGVAEKIALWITEKILNKKERGGPKL